MEYERSRFEKIMNEDESVKEIFIAVRLHNDTDVWEQGYWLTDAERDAVVIDEQALNAIVDNVAIMGELALAKYKSEPPEEPEI